MAEAKNDGRLHNIGPQSLSGPASAWNIAFNDLKRRYWLSQNENIRLKGQNQKVTAEICQANEHIEFLQKQIRHMDILYATKCTSYEKLEDQHNDLRVQEKLQDRHAKGLCERVDSLNGERKLFQKEFAKIVEENQTLRNSIEMVQREKRQLENELDNVRNIPEISISSSSVASTTSKEGSNKQMDELISENKHLKTSIHWLSDELNKLKTEKQCGSEKKVHLTGCLEEGFNNMALQFDFPKDKKDINLPSYIEMLHNTINVLKKQLAMSTQQIKKFMDCNLSSECLPPPQQNGDFKIVQNFIGNKGNLEDIRNVTFDTPFIDVNMPSYNISSNGSNSNEVDQKVEKNTLLLSQRGQLTNSFSPIQKSSPPGDIMHQVHNIFHSPTSQNQPNENDTTMNSRSLFPPRRQNNVSDGIRVDDCVDLHPSLLHNVQLQQTQTYLKAAPVPAIRKHPHLKPTTNGYSDSSEGTLDPASYTLVTPQYPMTGSPRRAFSKHIQIYDEHE